MQILTVILSFIFGRMNKSTHSLKDSAMELIDEMIGKSRKPVALILAGIIGVALFCGGLFITALNLASQYDLKGFVNFTATLGVGIGLLLISSGAFAFVFLKAWPRQIKRPELPMSHQTPKVSSLEQALSVLVMDFVKERELKRSQPDVPRTSPLRNQPKATPASPHLKTEPPISNSIH